jgi:hypothetical protein
MAPAPSHEGFSGVPACPASGPGQGVVSQPLRAPQAGLRAQSVEGPRLRALSASSVRGGTRAQEISAALQCRAPPPSRAGATNTHGHTLEAGEIADRLRSPSHTEAELAVLPQIVVAEILRRSSVQVAKDLPQARGRSPRAPSRFSMCAASTGLRGRAARRSRPPRSSGARRASCRAPSPLRSRRTPGRTDQPRRCGRGRTTVPHRACHDCTRTLPSPRAARHEF